MAMHHRDVQSSQIARVGYDSKARLLEITFHGRGDQPGSRYHYDAVTPAEYDALMRASSIGAHFARHIRNAKEYRRIA